MSDDRDDLELEALQRQLDDAFATTRPRRDFEDELWLRMQARRPATSRLRDAIAAVAAGFREAPAIPLGAVALVLIVAVGIGVLATGVAHLNRSSASGGAFSQAAPADRAAGEFGRLPTPRLNPGAVNPPPSTQFSGPAASEGFAPMPFNVYFGPATLDWTGTFVTAQVQAPVLGYAEPSVTDSDQFAASIGASGRDLGALPSGYVGVYSGTGFTLSVRGTVAQVPREPYFFIAPTTPIPTNDAPGRFSLAPSWPSARYVIPYGQGERIVYGRRYPLPDGSVADFINSVGDPDGIEVDVVNDNAVAVAGQFPVGLTAANYLLISNDAALRDALTSSPAGATAFTPTPVVHLDQAVLVYALAVKNGRGYFEPAYLFSGTFKYNGQTYTKRVLVPLVDPSQRMP